MVPSSLISLRVAKRDQDNGSLGSGVGCVEAPLL